MKDVRKKLISEAELQAAIRKFESAGGMIKKLPDQKIASSQMVGVRWNNSEVTGEPT